MIAQIYKRYGMEGKEWRERERRERLKGRI
jgi:hypothetical protein